MSISKSETIQKRFEGVKNTPLLWKTDSSIPLKQLILPSIEDSLFYDSKDHPENLRLGKQVESFIEFDLNSNLGIEIIDKNVQIRENKLTVGEIDLLLEYDSIAYHVEIVYKFYLYNPEIGQTQLEHWIGPNNNDSLVEKLTKLQNKQHPLLFRTETKPYLDDLKLKAQNIEQTVIFKGQLFLPYHQEIEPLENINTDCIVGKYLRYKDLEYFTEASFYIPIKLDWLIKPEYSVDWRNYKTFLNQIKKNKEERRALMFWIKNEEGILSKFFLYFDKME